MMTINCPKCNAAMQVDESAAGQTVQCYACQVPFQVPAPAAAPAAVPAATAAAPAAPAAAQAKAALANAQAQAAAVAGKAFSALSCGTGKLMQSKFGKNIALWIGVVALVSTIILWVLLIAVVNSRPSFSSDAEDTAEMIFEQYVNRNGMGFSKEAYFWNKFGDDCIDDAEYEVLEKDDYAVVLVKSKINGKTIAQVYTLMKNSDGKYIEISGREFAEGVGRSWLEDNGKKIGDHEDKDESDDINYDNID